MEGRGYIILVTHAHGGEVLPHMSLPRGISKAADMRPRLSEGRVRADHLGKLVWAILRLCNLLISLGTAARRDLFSPLTFRDESCPITLACFGEGTVHAFRSLHPCAVSDMEPSTLWPHSGY